MRKVPESKLSIYNFRKIPEGRQPGFAEEVIKRIVSKPEAASDANRACYWAFDSLGSMMENEVITPPQMVHLYKETLKKVTPDDRNNAREALEKADECREYLSGDYYSEAKKAYYERYTLIEQYYNTQSKNQAPSKNEKSQKVTSKLKSIFKNPFKSSK